MNKDERGCQRRGSGRVGKEKAGMDYGTANGPGAPFSGRSALIDARLRSARMHYLSYAADSLLQ